VDVTVAHRCQVFAISLHDIGSEAEKMDEHRKIYILERQQSHHLWIWPATIEVFDWVDSSTAFRTTHNGISTSGRKYSTL